MAKVQIKSEKLTHFVFFRLPFKQTIIQCTKIQNILGQPLLIGGNEWLSAKKHDSLLQ